MEHRYRLVVEKTTEYHFDISSNDVDDIVIALSLALNYSGNFKIMNLGSGKKTSINMLFGYFKNEMLYKKEPLYLKEREGDVKHMVMDCNSAFENLKWRPKISLEDGIKNLVSGNNK